MKSFEKKTANGTLRVGIHLFIVRKAHGNECMGLIQLCIMKKKREHI